MRLARDDVASSKPQNQQSQSEICNTVTLCNTLKHSVTPQSQSEICNDSPPAGVSSTSGRSWPNGPSEHQ